MKKYEFIYYDNDLWRYKYFSTFIGIRLNVNKLYNIKRMKPPPTISVTPVKKKDVSKIIKNKYNFEYITKIAIRKK
jgi:hypothetical protein